MALLSSIFTALLFISVEMATSVKSAPDVPEYFPEIEGDLSKVTWSHATNSIEKLEAAILNDTMMMLEADVLLGTVTGGGTETVPIMAHPPDTESDLSLQQFLDEVLQANTNGKRKGIKLDFKSLEVVPIALEMLGQMSGQIGFPAWLNADIQQGPVNSTRVPIDADQFLSVCKEKFPESTLSVGWTTRFGTDAFPPIISGNYTMEMAEGMLKALTDNQITQPVTFPIRASLTAHSGDVIRHLLQETKNSTLTLWGPATDVVDVPALKQVVDSVGRARVYMDIPENLKEQLTSGSSVGMKGTLLTSVFALVATAVQMMFK